MASRATILRFTNSAVVFHWLIAALAVAQVVIGFTFHRLLEEGPQRAMVFTWHKTIGATILVLTLLRLAYRLRNPPPPYAPDVPAWRQFSALWVHRLLYVLLIALPLTGLIAVSDGAESWFTPLVGGIPLPVVPGVSEPTGELSGTVHEILVWTTLALLVLHVGAALFEQFVWRQHVAARMPPFRAEGVAAIPARAAEIER